MERLEESMGDGIFIEKRERKSSQISKQERDPYRGVPRISISQNGGEERRDLLSRENQGRGGNRTLRRGKVNTDDYSTKPDCTRDT